MWIHPKGAFCFGNLRQCSNELGALSFSNLKTERNTRFDTSHKLIQVNAFIPKEAIDQNEKSTGIFAWN